MLVFKSNTIIQHQMSAIFYSLMIQQKKQIWKKLVFEKRHQLFGNKLKSGQGCLQQQRAVRRKLNSQKTFEQLVFNLKQISFVKQVCPLVDIFRQNILEIRLEKEFFFACWIRFTWTTIEGNLASSGRWIPHNCPRLVHLQRGSNRSPSSPQHKYHFPTRLWKSS